MDGCNSPGHSMHNCILNVGLYRSGTTTLVEAARRVGFHAYNEFPQLSKDQYRAFLFDPAKAIFDYCSGVGTSEIVHLASSYDLISDGWVALLPFLPIEELECLRENARNSGVELIFVATSRSVEATVASELQHWVVHDLERKAGLTAIEREHLERDLFKRSKGHKQRLNELIGDFDVQVLPLESNLAQRWSKTMASLGSRPDTSWFQALESVGVQNANSSLPTEGILLTLRLGTTSTEFNLVLTQVEKLLDQVEEDSLCQYILVLALDEDEAGTTGAYTLMKRLSARAGPTRRLKSFQLIENPATPQGKPFPICKVWDRMATVAWNNGADWVVLLGDDVSIQCPFHYRATYRAFQDCAEQVGVDFGFGCVIWNDVSFPGFPSFPCVGKAHFKIFGGLVPAHRNSRFYNQDLDPFLYRLYLKFLAAPWVHEATLCNESGGNLGSSQEPRYERVPCKGWKDFVADDEEPIRRYLRSHSADEPHESILLDVVVPSFRIRLDYLQRICSLDVPEYCRTLFIIIIDDPIGLLVRAAEITGQVRDELSLTDGERVLEDYLTKRSGGNTIRVRCNERNVGASASRNRGLDESAADFVLNLDDDVIVPTDLLQEYGRRLRQIDDDVVGLVGLVRFPRSPRLPLKHAAVLMSYLTFMFEIAETAGSLYRETGCCPAWGVTANILFRRTLVRFDEAYAKTGGGEDVDFSLQIAKEDGTERRLVAVPKACVVHQFWPGSIWTLCSHFFNWAVGDGGLLQRFPQHRYWSYPNLPETIFLLLLPMTWWLGPFSVLKVVPWFLLIDFMVDLSNQTEYKHRCTSLEDPRGETPGDYRRTELFYLSAHVLANLYVVVLECGRLWGHLRRGNVYPTIFHRFDWHCGRLTRAPENFRRREARKFGLFVLVAAMHGYVALRDSLPPHWLIGLVHRLLESG